MTTVTFGKLGLSTPSSWGDNAELVLLGPDGGLGHRPTIALRSQAAGKGGFTELARTQVEQLARELHGYEAVSNAAAQFGSIRGHLHENRCSIGGSVMFQRHFVFAAGRDLCTVIVTTLGGDAQQAREASAPVFSSLKAG